KHIILIVGSLVLLSIIVFTIYWSVTNKSILGQVNDLDKAIVNKNYDKVSEMLKVEGRPISKSESKHLVDYLNKPENKKRYNKEINQIRTIIKNNTQSDSEIGRITDKNKKPIITISRDG
ncbi:TcaA second domain-containing protein, partial [Mycobacteroides abscessus]